MLQTSLGTYIIGAVCIISGVGIFLRGRATASTPKDEKLNAKLRVYGALIIGGGVILVLSEWIFVSNR